MLYLVAGLPFSGQWTLIELAARHNFTILCYEDDYKDYQQFEMSKDENRLFILRCVKDLKELRALTDTLYFEKAIFVLRRMAEWTTLRYTGCTKLVYLRSPLSQRLRELEQSKQNIAACNFYYKLTPASINENEKKDQGEAHYDSNHQFQLSLKTLTVIDTFHECETHDTDNTSIIHEPYINLEWCADHVVNVFTNGFEPFDEIIAEMNNKKEPELGVVRWDKHFMRLSEAVSSRANCMKRRSGAVYVRNNRIVSTGYNGTASSTKDCLSGGCYRCSNLIARKAKLLENCNCLHAEQNALFDSGSSQNYHYAKSGEAVLYSTTFPCIGCTKILVESGVNRVVYLNPYYKDDLSMEYMKNHGIIVERLLEQL